jgi:hypothetical protein
MLSGALQCTPSTSGLAGMISAERRVQCARDFAAFAMFDEARAELNQLTEEDDRLSTEVLLLFWTIRDREVELRTPIKAPRLFSHSHCLPHSGSLR